jgi:hypothetical protein
MEEYTGPKIVEGYLKKKKNDYSLKFFSNFTKRWFTLDLSKGIFYYSAGKGKDASKVIHLRDVVSVKECFEGDEDKDYKFAFVINTVARTFKLYA